MSRPPLAVWLYGTRIGLLEEPEDGRILLTWSAEAYDRWGGNARVVSHLLPLEAPGRTPHPARVKVFLDGLLPEGNARTNYAIDAGLASEDTFGLIARYGRDTAGALVFQPPEAPSPAGAGHYEPITADEVGERLLAADRHSPTDPRQRGVESLSLAGMQPKIGLHRIHSRWQACKDGAPSTWIIKAAHPADSDAADVVDTEVLSLDLARRIGLSSIDAEVCDFGGVRGIAVSRYDRKVLADRIERVHQEDLAQALGINTGDPNRKFQRGNRTPSLRHAVDVLRGGGSEPHDLLRLVTFNHLIGNTDFHAKNISFMRHDDGSVVLAPAYDTAMHLHHPRQEPLSALDVNGRYRMLDITVDDLVDEGRSWGLPERRARALVADTVAGLGAALAEVDPDAYPRVGPTAWRTVRDRLDAAAKALSSGVITAEKVRAAPEPDRPPVGDVEVAAPGRGGTTSGPRRRRGPRRGR